MSDDETNVVAIADVLSAREREREAEAYAKARLALERAIAIVTSEHRYVGGGTDSLGPIYVGWVPCGRNHGANVRRGKTWGRAILFPKDDRWWPNVATKRALLGTPDDLSFDEALDRLAWHYMHPPEKPGPGVFVCHLCEAKSETVSQMIHPENWERVTTQPVILLPPPDDPIPLLPKPERVQFWLCPDCVLRLWVDYGGHTLRS